MARTTYTPGIADQDAWNYGFSGNDRTHNLQVSYSYDLPDLGKHYGVAPLGWFVDNWQFSGITSVQSGAPFNPGCGLTSGSKGVTGGYTGTPDVSQRCQVIGDPLLNVGPGRIFNGAAFAMPALATGPNNSIVGPPALGNRGGGAGVLRRPTITNFDMTLTKVIPLGSERRVLKLQAQAYNAFNHAEFSSENTGIQFGPTTNLVTNASAVGLNTDTVKGSNRIMAFSARIEF
jgi:hypothetical protein